MVNVNRGIYGSLSSVPVEMGDCGTAYVDISPEFPNLCFETPLITTGGAKPLSLSLLYNERADAPSSGDVIPGFRLNLHRLLPEAPSGDDDLVVHCPDGPSRGFSRVAEDPFWRSEEDPALFAEDPDFPSDRARLYLNQTDYLTYGLGNPFPLSCSSSTEGNPTFETAFEDGFPASVALEGGRTLEFVYAFGRVAQILERRGGDVIQTVVLGYAGSGGATRLSRVTAYLGGLYVGNRPFRDVSFSKTATARVWKDELRSLEWSFAWDSTNFRVPSFSRSYPSGEEQAVTSPTSISYFAHSATVTGPSGRVSTTYFKGDIPYMSCDDQGVAEAFRHDEAKRRLLYRSGPVCLDAFSPLNEGQLLDCPFFGTGSASAWGLPAGHQTQDPIGIGPAPYPDNTEAVLAASLSQTVEVSGLPGDSYTALALIRGAGVPLALTSSLTIVLLDSSSAYSESSSRRSLFTGAQGRPEILAASATAKASFDRVSVSIEGPSAGVVVEAVLLLKRPAAFSASYDSAGRLVSEGGSSEAAMYRDEARPYLIGGPHSFTRFALPSAGQDYESQATRSAWGLHALSLKNLSTHMVEEIRHCADSIPGVSEEYVDYGPGLLPAFGVSAVGVPFSRAYAQGSDLLSSSQIGSGQVSRSESYSYGAQGCPWAVSSILHSSSSGEDWRVDYGYGDPHLGPSSASEGEGAEPFSPQAATAWARDPLGNPTSVTQSSAAYASMSYADQNGTRLLSSLSYGTGSFSWAYDPLRRPASLSYAEPNQAPITLGAYSYDGFGRPTQALGESYAWNDDGSLASLQFGNLSIAHSRFGPHSSEVISFAGEGPAVICSHGPEACSYGDPGLAKALFQLIPGLLSTVFEGDPLSEPSGTSWQPAPADLEMRHSGGSLASLTVDPLASLERHGSAACLRQVDGMANTQNLRYAFPSPGPASSLPGMSFGAWLYPGGEWSDGVLLQLSLGCSYSGDSGSAGASLVLRLADSGAELVAQSAQGGEEVLIPDVPFSIGAWNFVCVGLSFGGQGNALDSVSLRVDSITRYAGPPISLPPMPFPQAGATVELSLLGPAIAVPFPPTVAQRPVPGLVYSPFATIGGRALTEDEASFAFRETGRALLGGADSLPSPLAARTFLRSAAPAGIEAIVPLEGGFSPIVGSLRPSRVTAPSGPMARVGDLFRYDPVEHRFRYYSGGDELYWSVPTLGDGLCLAFCVRPSDLGDDAPEERTLCAVGLGAGLCSLVLSGTSLYLRSAEGDSLLGACAPSSSSWVVLAFWQRSVGSGFLPRKESGVTVYFGDGYAFTWKSATLGFAMPAEAKVLFGQPSYAPFGGFVDRLCLWRGAWSFSKMAAVRSFFEGQKASVEEIDPFGQLASRSLYGPSGLSVSSAFSPLAEERPADEPLLRLGLVGGEAVEVNGAPVPSLGKRYAYDALARLAGTYAAGDEPGEGDPIEAYFYDGLGRLKTWTDPNGETTQYTWSGGHITRAKKGQLFPSTFSYSGHRLTSVSRTSITYRSDAPMLVDRIGDAAGQGGNYASLSYMGRTVTGVAVQGNFPMTPCSFSYDARGRRTSKTSNGVAHSYFYEGSALIRESITGSPSHDIRFFYHMSGAPAFMTLDGVAYYYVVDAFGSVVGLVDGDGSLVVTYSYDPWGNILSTTDTSGVGLANLNPLRYRSYYYDSETRWYLCGSRYYSPEWMRWVTPDSVDYLDPETPGGLDPYAYCYGDPVNYADPSGHSAFLIALLVGIVSGVMIGGALNLGHQLYENGYNWADIDWFLVAGNAIFGGAIGVATVLGGAAGMAYAGFAVGGYTLSVGASLAISSAVVAAGNALNYSFTVHGDITPEGLWGAAWKGALKGAVTFGLSFYSGANGLFLSKTYSGISPQKFFFLRPQSAWVQDSLVYSMYGEFGLRTITVSAPGAILRWFIDQW